MRFEHIVEPRFAVDPHHDLHRPQTVERLPIAVQRTAIRRDGNQCVLCHRTRQLHVHHIDGCGARSARPNHGLSNLVTLCARCHLVLHRNNARFTPELVAKASERRMVKPINLQYRHGYEQNSYVARPHKAIDAGAND